MSDRSSVPVRAASASPRAVASGQTSATRPHSPAWAALMRAPVITWYLARDRPIRRASRWVPPLPGIMPSFTSGSANSLRAVASLMSHDRAISRPTPKQ